MRPLRIDGDDDRGGGPCGRLAQPNTADRDRRWRGRHLRCRVRADRRIAAGDGREAKQCGATTEDERGR